MNRLTKLIFFLQNIHTRLYACVTKREANKFEKELKLLKNVGIEKPEQCENFEYFLAITVIFFLLHSNEALFQAVFSIYLINFKQLHVVSTFFLRWHRVCVFVNRIHKYIPCHSVSN
jgi:hypothetical protein